MFSALPSEQPHLLKFRRWGRQFRHIAWSQARALSNFLHKLAYARRITAAQIRVMLIIRPVPRSQMRKLLIEEREEHALRAGLEKKHMGRKADRACRCPRFRHRLQI